MSKRALIIRHVPYEGVAGFRAPIEDAGYEIDRVDVGDPEFPKLDLVAPDLLIMMGGPMSVYEREHYPWIGCQLRRLARRLETDRPTLGVCFGAQMIAAALGAEVYPGVAQEIGFAPLTLHEPDGPLRHLTGLPVLHWHGDTFALPDGARLLASTNAYRHQAFGWGRATLALQFHAEMGRDDRFECWIDQSQTALDAAGISADALRWEYRQLGPAALAAGQTMIADWLATIGAPQPALAATLT